MGNNTNISQKEQYSSKPTPEIKRANNRKIGCIQTEKLICNTCQISNIKQTSRNLKSRSQEHTRYIKTTDPIQPTHYIALTADMNMAASMTR